VIFHSYVKLPEGNDPNISWVVITINTARTIAWLVDKSNNPKPYQYNSHLNSISWEVITHDIKYHKYVETLFKNNCGQKLDCILPSGYLT